VLVVPSAGVITDSTLGTFLHGNVKQPLWSITKKVSYTSAGEEYRVTGTRKIRSAKGKF